MEYYEVNTNKEYLQILNGLLNKGWRIVSDTASTTILGRAPYESAMIQFQPKE